MINPYLNHYFNFHLKITQYHCVYMPAREGDHIIFMY